MTHSTKGKKLLPILIFTLCFVLLLSSVFTFNAFAEGTTPIGENNTFKVAHISDVHYFPNDLCPTEYSEDSTYALTIKEYFKLIPESGTMLNATCQKLLEKAVSEKLDAIIVSGDLTKDGEFRAHVDLANRLRKLQDDIRKATGNPDFQIFVVLGNHDTFNSKTNDYLGRKDEGGNILTNSGEPTRINTTTTAQFMHIYSGLGYPNFTDADIKKYTDESVNKTEFDKFNTPFMSFYNSTLSSAYDYSYFKDSVKDYSADYVIKLFNLSVKAGATLSEKEDVISKEPQALNAYNNVTKQNVCTYVAVPNGKKPSLDGFVVSMIDSSLREPKASARYGYEHITGGRIMDTTFNWLKDALTFTNSAGKKVSFAERQDTVISSMHHGTVPHLTTQESFMTDFILYDWEESAVKLTDLGIKYSLTGHVHATDVATYVADNGKELVDIVTGSLISYGSPIRYATFSRSLALGVITDKLSDTTQTITSFKGVPMTMTDTSKTIDKDKTLGKWFNDDTTDGVEYNYIDDVQKYMYDTVLVNFIPNLLEGYVNEGLVKTLTANFSKDQDLNIFVSELIEQLFSMKPKYINGVEQESLVKYVYTLVHDFIGYKETAENDFLATVKFENKKAPGTYFTLGDILIESYVKYLVNGEVKTVDDSGILYSLREYAKDGSLAKQLFGDPKTYNQAGKKSGLLYPLLYADNNLIDQVLDFKFDFSSSKMSAGGLKVAKALFGLLDIKFDETTNYSFSLNQIIKVAAKAGKSFGTEAGTVGTIFAGLNANGGDVTALARDFVNSYAVDNFYVNISGVLYDIIESFSLDQDKIGSPLKVDGDGVQENGRIYTSGNASISPSEYQRRGFTPALLTLSFGKTNTEMNLTWTTAAFRNSTITVDGVDSSNVEIKKVNTAYGYPLFDLGLLSKLTNESKYEQQQQIIKNGFAKTTKFMNVYTVTVKNLEPGKKYTYKITTTNEEGSTITNIPGHTQNGEFTTAKDSGKFTFLGITDIQGTLQSSYDIAKSNIEKAIAEAGIVDFIVNCGDVTDNGKNVKQWNYALNVTNGYNPTTNYKTLFSTYPTVITAGNHEKSGSVLARYFNIKNGEYVFDKENPTEEEIAKADKIIKSSMESGLFYSFKYANAKFIVLNTNTATVNGLPKEQYDWLVKELRDEEGIDWKIVVMHKGLYTLGEHTNDVEVKGLRSQLTPLLYDMGVDLVLQGHDHTFTTTKFLDRNGNPVDNSNASITTSEFSYDTPNGVLYATMGTIADKFYKYNENSGFAIDETHSITNTLDSATYCYFTVDGKQLQINYRSFNAVENAKLKAKPITIAKNRAAQTGDVTVKGITLKVNGENVNVNLNSPSEVYSVPSTFTLNDMTITKGDNSTWKKWDLQYEAVEYGTLSYKSISPLDKLGANLGSESTNVRLAVYSEDGKTVKYYPFKLRVNNIIEDRLGELLYVNGKPYYDGLKFNYQNKNGHLSLALLDDPTATITKDDSLLKDKNVMKYFVEKDGMKYVVEIKGYNLGDGENGVTIFVSDEEGNIIKYSVGVTTPAKPNTLLIVIIIAVVVVISLVVTNKILKKKRGKGLFGFMDKFKKKKSDEQDVIID